MKKLIKTKDFPWIELNIGEYNEIEELIATKEDSIIGNNFYETNKPIVNESDSFILDQIYINVNESLTGYISYNLNGVNLRLNV